MSVRTDARRSDETPPSPGPRRPPRWAAALAGVTAAGLALAVTEFVGALGSGGPSLVPAMGSWFIDEEAGSLKDFAVSTFGTNDKAALITGIVIISLALGALFGVLSLRNRWFGATGFAAFAAVGLVIGLDTPLTSVPALVFAAILGVAAGIAALIVLLELATRPPYVAPRPGARPRPRAEDPRVRAATRRAVLGAGGVAGLAIASTAAARAVRSARTVSRGRSEVTLPPAARSVATVPPVQPFSVPGLTPYVTPNADFYRIDTALLVPRVNADRWQLRIDGMVDHPLAFTYDQLLGMEMVEAPITIQCVSNEVGGDLIGNAVWRGVALAPLLEQAGVHAEATQIVGRSVDDFTVGFPTAAALDGRTALIVVGMNGEPLPTSHGFPARLLVAGLYGYVSATKWLTRIELTRWEDFDAYWVPRGWAKEGPIKTQSRIDVPRSDAHLSSGPVMVAGVAWAPTRGISKVEINVDDGPWMPAALGSVASKDTWVQWRAVWDAAPGTHVITVRATDGTGTVQSAAKTRPDPDGASGYHARQVEVA